MSTPEGNKEPPEGRRTENLRRKITALLSSWYGQPEDSCLIVHHLPKTKTVAEVMDSIGEQIYPKNVYLLTQIQELWADIAGKSAATKTRPLFLQNKVLKVEVIHPAYLMSLNSTRVKNAIVMKINALFSDDVCAEIQFVPVGRSGTSFRKGN